MICSELTRTEKSWPILVSGRASTCLAFFSSPAFIFALTIVADLCNLRDEASLKIATKKILELSHGHFSDDNQKAITPVNGCVPVYEAKASRDMR